MRSHGNTPLDYMGSKNTWANKLVKFLPFRFDHFVDAFAGAAGFPLALIENGYVRPERVHLNDESEPMMAFWEVLRDYQEEMNDELFRQMLVHGAGTRQLHDESCHGILNGETLGKGISYYIYNRTVVLGVFRPNGSAYANPAKSGKGLRRNRIKNLKTFANRIQGVNLSCGDYRKIPIPSRETLLFFDPPYGDANGERACTDESIYGAGIIHEEFVGHCEAIKDDCHILITYADSVEAREAFKGWNLVAHRVFAGSTQGDYRDELIITNYDVPYAEMWCDDLGWKLVA